MAYENKQTNQIKTSTTSATTSATKWVFVGYLKPLSLIVRNEYTNKNGKKSVLITKDNLSFFIPSKLLHFKSEKDDHYISLPSDMKVNVRTTKYIKETGEFVKVKEEELTAWELKLLLSPRKEKDLPF